MPAIVPSGSAQRGKADIDGHAALLLLFEPVRVGSRERLNQRGFAVIYVSGGSDDDVLHV